MTIRSLIATVVFALFLIPAAAQAQVSHSERGFAISVAALGGYQDTVTIDRAGSPSVSGITAGVKGGIEYKVFTDKIRIAPSFGVSIDKDGNDSLFGDFAVLYAFPKVYVGGGATARANHTGLDANRVGYLATAGYPFHDGCWSIVAEFKHYLDTNTTKKVAVAGIKYVF